MPWEERVREWEEDAEESVGGPEWWSGGGWDSAWRLERELPPDKSQFLGFAINLSLQNRHVLVSFLSALISFLSHSSSGRICFFFCLCNRSWSLPLPHLHVIHFYTLPSLLAPSSLLSPSCVWDGGLAPSKSHYSNFLCNMNDSDPLFILELLITTQPTAHPPRQASHSHSRRYFIRRVRLRRASMVAAVIRCGAADSQRGKQANRPL